jgi:hypothetical protein
MLLGDVAARGATSSIQMRFWIGTRSSQKAKQGWRSPFVT